MKVFFSSALMAVGMMLVLIAWAGSNVESNDRWRVFAVFVFGVITFALGVIAMPEEPRK